MARLAALTAWLLIGAGAVFGLYWLLLATPESNAPALGASVILILAILFVCAIVVNAAVAIGASVPATRAIALAPRTIHVFLIVAVAAVAMWWLLVAGDRWVATHSGEISAWFIARFGWSRIDRLFAAEMWISRWLRWTVIPLLALSLLARLLEARVRASSPEWRRPQLRWQTLALTIAVFAVLVAAPLPLAFWRPALPATWVEPGVAAIRLGIVAVLWAAAAALLVLLATSPTTIAARPPQPAPTTPRIEEAG